MNELAILITALVGGAIFIGVSVGLLLFLQLRKKMQKPVNMKKTALEAPSELVAPTNFERMQFCTRLHALRADSALLEQLLSSASATVSSSSSSNLSSALHFKLVARNLARVVFLLRCSERQLCHPPAPPSDWCQLLQWAECVVNNHKLSALSCSSPPSPSSVWQGESVCDASQPGNFRLPDHSGVPSSKRPYPSIFQSSSLMRSPRVPALERGMCGAYSLPRGLATSRKPLPETKLARAGSKLRSIRYGHSTLGKRKRPRHARPTDLHRIASVPNRAKFPHKTQTPPVSHNSANCKHALTDLDRGTCLHDGVANNTERSAIYIVDTNRSVALEEPVTKQHVRPTYFDWPSLNTGRKYLRQSNCEPAVTSDVTDTTDVQSIDSQVGGPAPPPPPVFLKDSRTIPFT